MLLLTMSQKITKTLGSTARHEQRQPNDSCNMALQGIQDPEDLQTSPSALAPSHAAQQVKRSRLVQTFMTAEGGVPVCACKNVSKEAHNIQIYRSSSVRLDSRAYQGRRSGLCHSWCSRPIRRQTHLLADCPELLDSRPHSAEWPPAQHPGHQKASNQILKAKLSALPSACNERHVSASDGMV